MTQDQLLIFALAAETLNFSETARRLYLSQPTVSQQIKALERQVGAELFERTGRGLRLTGAGEVLYPFARRVRLELEAAESAMRMLHGEVAGPLRLGASTTIGSYWLPALLVRFHQSHPGVRVSLAIENSTKMLEQLLHGELHLLMIEGERPALSDESLEVQPFREDSLVLITAPERVLDGEAGLQALAALPWILREPGSGTREILFAQLAAEGIDPATLPVAMELGNTEAIKRAVAAGAGIACVSALSVEEELASGQLKAVPTLCLRRSLWLIRAVERYQSPAARAFLAFLAGWQEGGGPHS